MKALTIFRAYKKATLHHWKIQALIIMRGGNVDRRQLQARRLRQIKRMERRIGRCLAIFDELNELGFIPEHWRNYEKH